MNQHRHTQNVGTGWLYSFTKSSLAETSRRPHDDIKVISCNIKKSLPLLQPFGELSCLIDGDTKENTLNE